MKIGLDANALSSLIKENEKDFGFKILQFLNNNNSGDLEIVISNIVLAEIMSSFKSDEIEKMNKLLEDFGSLKQLSFVSFDKKSALQNSKLVERLGIKSDEDKTRDTVKTDYIITSNYIAYGCDYFLTADKKLISRIQPHTKMNLIDTNTLPAPNKNLFNEPVLK